MYTLFFIIVKCKSFVCTWPWCHHSVWTVCRVINTSTIVVCRSLLLMTHKCLDCVKIHSRKSLTRLVFRNYLD